MFCDTRREMVSKLLYREEGQLFYRRGTSKEPHPPLPPSFLLAGPTPPPPIKRNLVLDPFVTHRDRQKILHKVGSFSFPFAMCFRYSDISSGRENGTVLQDWMLKLLKSVI